jgi:predicted Zn-dependent protease
MDHMLRPLFFGLIFALLTLPCFAQSATDQPAAPKAAAAEKVAVPAPQSSPATMSSFSPAPAGTLPMLSLLLRDARSLYSKGDFDAALAKYQEILKTHPQSPDAYAGEVRVYLKQKKVDVAAQTADQALAQSNHARIRVARGEVWFRQGKIFEAEKEWVDVAN